MRPVALTIAGSDPSGGAGLQADLAVFAAFGVHGTSVATALTVQDTRGVRAVAPVAADVVRAQVDAVLDDFDVRAAKTGMLHRAEVVIAVAERLDGVVLVVDPVATASDGTALLDEDGIDTLRRLLVPIAAVVTPNLREAELLVRRPVRNPEQMRAAARALVELGARAAVVKGGHLAGDALDVLYDGREFSELTAPRLTGGAVHGTGCALSAAIAAQLAVGRELADAVTEAKRFVTRAIAGAMAIGRGARVLDLRR